uniref:Uncharacterized protein n=1 Tax=Leersia perrieri TaxID=77586 RepID=A0A0D9WDS5_9ORYZ
MASTLHSAAVTILFVFLLASSSMSVLQARMVPASHDHHVNKESTTASNPTPGSTVDVSADSLAAMAPPMPPPTPAGKAPETTTTTTAPVGKRWGKAQLQGSVPSPGIGH